MSFVSVAWNDFSKLVGIGKLGHGDTSRVYKPKVIEALTGTHIRKVVCSGQSSVALTSTGQVHQTPLLYIYDYVCQKWQVQR